MTRAARFATWCLASVAVAGLGACGGGGGGSDTPVVVSPPPAPPPPPPPTVTASPLTVFSTAAPRPTATPPLPAIPAPLADGVLLSGRVTFDRVPTDGPNGGLDYASTRQDPVRFAFAEVLDARDTAVAAGFTDADGNYSFVVPADTDLRVRVLARTSDPAGETAEWDVAVVDNTNGNAQYALQGALASSGSAASTRDLNADSGWDGSSYSAPRVSGPFAVLDSATEAVLATVGVDADVVLPPVQFRWSPENVPAPGDPAVGQISTSSYQTRSTASGEVDRALFILGDAGVDTDEFDETVIIHEWGHYFEDQVSRSDSLGGQHSLNDRLDARVALGEGFGNALSGIVTKQRFYRDTSGEGQGRGFSIDLDRNPTGQNAGWYSERTVQGLLWDLFDGEATNTAASDDDSLSGGYAPLYAALADPDYVGVESFTTIFPLIESIARNAPELESGLRSLATSRGINGTGDLGAGETNGGGITERLPVYRDLVIGAAPVEMCSVDDAGFYNKLGNRALFRMEVPSDRNLTIRMERTSGLTNRDPDFDIFQAGRLRYRGVSGETDAETGFADFAAGTYYIDAYDFWNVVPETPAGGEPRGDTCFNVSVE